jgi:UDP-glucose:(heptosyl)LPS alpha-1,3-glucosyltransferase
MIAGTLALRRRRRGIVQATGAIVLSRLDVTAVHYCHQVGPANASRDTAVLRGQAVLASLMKRYGERLCFAVNRPRAIVCVSDGVADEVREYFPALADRIETIHNGVDVSHFSPASRAADAAARREQLGLAPGTLVAAFVGGEWERKGLEPALRAIAAAGDWHLLVAGAGDAERYRRLAQELGVAGRLHLIGVTSDVALVYQMSDAFILPSSYESFSLVTFEAAASGLPILAAPVSGVRELIDDERNGMLITREPGMIAERLRRLAADPGLRSRLGAAARESALAFSSERMTREHHELYQRLAGLEG